MTECFWCQNIYDKEHYDKCPRCLSNTNTTEITIINLREEDQSVKEKPDWAERILRSRARFYQEGLAHGAELEQERIIQILDENLGKMDWDDLICLIRGDDNGNNSIRS